MGCGCGDTVAVAATTDGQRHRRSLLCRIWAVLTDREDTVRRSLRRRSGPHRTQARPVHLQPVPADAAQPARHVGQSRRPHPS